MIRLAVFLGAMFVATAAAARTDCKAIQDATARLACFDKRVVPPTAKAAKKTAPAKDEFGEAKAAMSRKLSDPDSARWQDFFKVPTSNGNVICGTVNSKNRMGGYVGFVGFIYEPRFSRATQMFSGGTDPEYSGISAATYCLHCATDPRGDKNIAGFCPGLIDAYKGR